MRDLGLGALSHANRHAAYFSMENPRWPELSILQAAHAAELLIKARIAQEHPLLIFDQLPAPTKAAGPRLDILDLYAHGRTVQWQDLPSRLWAATGMSVPNERRFVKFGFLRNTVQHFAAPPKLDIAEETLLFVFNVIDPFIHNSWGLFAIDYDEDYEPYVYFVETLIHREILFLVSKEAAASSKDWDPDWSGVSKHYRKELERRVQAALGKQRNLFHKLT